MKDVQHMENIHPMESIHRMKDIQHMENIHLMERIHQMKDIQDMEGIQAGSEDQQEAEVAGAATTGAEARGHRGHQMVEAAARV